MSLDIILQVIRDTGEAKIQELELRSCSQAREIVANARQEAESIREQACAATMEPASRERARLIQKARLDALRAVGEAREALVDAALEQCREQLVYFRAESMYPEVLRRLLQETLVELESSLVVSETSRNACLEVDLRDRDTIGRLVAELELSLTVNYSLSCWGGLIAKSEDGRVAIINTLESRFERATPFLRRSLAALFEETGQEIVESRLMERFFVL